MKIDKIKMIENPIEDFQLDQESMKALLGGDFCGIRVGNHCQGYQSGLSCIGTEGTKSLIPQHFDLTLFIST